MPIIHPDQDGGSVTPPVTLTGTDGATTPLTLKGAATQIGGSGADVFEILDGNGNLEVNVTSDGDLSLTGGYRAYIAIPDGNGGYMRDLAQQESIFDPNNGSSIFMNAKSTNVTLLHLQRAGTDVLVIQVGQGALLALSPLVAGDLGLAIYPLTPASAPSLRINGWIADGSDVFAAVEVSARGGLQIGEQPDGDLPAPADDVASLYVRDNGAGKSQLVVRFNTGAVQVLATQP